MATTQIGAGDTDLDVGCGGRYTIGAISVAGEAIFPGRLFGGDRYNPYTATVHLYSDVPAIAVHEGGHAKDLTRRDWPGTYGFVTALPFVNLWGEAITSGDAIAYADRADEKRQVEGLVDFGRARFLVPVPKVASLAERNETLEDRFREDLGPPAGRDGRCGSSG